MSERVTRRENGEEVVTGQRSTKMPSAPPNSNPRWKFPMHIWRRRPPYDKGRK